MFNLFHSNAPYAASRLKISDNCRYTYAHTVPWVLLLSLGLGFDRGMSQPDAESMDLELLIKKHKRKAGDGEDLGGAPSGKKKANLGDAADEAEDGLQQVEGALRARDMQQAISILLKMACMHAQLLRDLAASEWVCLVVPTLSFLVVAGRGAGKMYAEAAAIAAAKPHLGPPHLYIARGVFKSMVDSEKLQKLGTQAYQTLVLFYEKFVSISSAAELGLVIRHFRLKKCYNEEYTRLQFAIGGDITVQLADAQGGPPERHLSKLEVEQSIIKLAQLEDAKLKLGTAPQGHLETMAQRILDKTKQKSKGKGAK